MDNNFNPNKIRKEILQERSFGGNYFRPLNSSITKKRYKNKRKGFPKDWFERLNIETCVASLI